MTVVTLLTDFGGTDAYVAEMKGSLLASWSSLATTDENPPVLVDVSHAVPRHDVAAGARLLASTLDVFPRGTIHVAVVDPGVGTDRRAIAVRTAGQYVLGPDNGLLTPALVRPDAEALVLDPVRHRRVGAPPSRVFDGRDLFAPAAAFLACGRAWNDLGVPCEPPPLRLRSPEAVVGPDGIEGEVVHVDAFGNARTNIPSHLVTTDARIFAGNDPRALRLVPAYGNIEAGAAAGVPSSDGHLEIAVREASAADRLGLRPGSPVRVRA